LITYWNSEKKAETDKSINGIFIGAGLHFTLFYRKNPYIKKLFFLIFSRFETEFGDFTKATP